MTTRLIVLPDADLEVEASVQWYEEQAPGQGQRLRRLVAAKTREIRSDPERWPCVGGGLRRALVRSFPYGILYEYANQTVTVVAVMHLSREPGYWRERLD